MKPLVIYHASCADGFGAAFAAWLKLGDEVEYVPVSYGEVGVGQLAGKFGQFRLCTKNNVIEVKDREVYILDFSFPKEVMNHMFTNAKRVVWLDHHKTAFEMWFGKYEKGMLYESLDDAERGFCEPHHICLDDNKSGAILAWEFFHTGKEVPMFIRHIDDYDRWVGMALVKIEKLEHAMQQAKLAADCIVGFSKDKPGGMCGWLDDACTAADTSASDIRSMLAAPKENANE